MEQKEITRLRLKEHLQSYPKLQAEDIFKYIFQSSFGCEHLVKDEGAALEYIKREHESADKSEPPRTDPLDGDYSRVHLSWLNGGLSAETLTRLFCASAKAEQNGNERLLQKLSAAGEMIENGELPLSKDDFAEKLSFWRESGYPAIHHSSVFRDEYRPAYRVIANEYIAFLPLFAKIDSLLRNGKTIIAIEGGSASGKSTLADMLKIIYDCSVFHMDDFFLRPEQRTAERLSEVGGNIDRERFLDEVLVPLRKGEEITFRPFDCSCGALAEPTTLTPTKLTVIEGVYSMHPELSKYYDLSVFLDISPEYQRERILKRNSPQFAQRFFNEWIPLENIYFSAMSVKERCDITLKIEASPPNQH